MAEVQRGLTNTQKAQILLDILEQVNKVGALNKGIDDIIKIRKYKAHPSKVKDYKNEIKTMIGGSKEVKKSLAVSFRTLAILQKAAKAKVKVDERKSTQMTKMISTLKG